MLFSPDRAELRKMFLEAWRKRREGRPVEPLEDLVAQIVEAHPEYHALLEDEDAVNRDFGVVQGQTNPFLHMAMHLAIREQVGSDRPAGFRALYAALAGIFPDAHALEHAVMECLGECLWEAQRSGKQPDERAYLDCVRALRRGGAGTRR